MRDLDAVIFDVGNTLLTIDHARALAILGAHGVPRLDVRAAERAEARARARMSDDLASRSGSTEERLTFRRYVGFTLEEAGVRVADAVLDGAFDALCVEARKHSFFDVLVPGAAEALERLSAAGLALGVVSNSDGTVAAKLGRHGIASRFRTIVDSAVVGVEKPDPRIFRAACARCGIFPERALYVGDLYSIDVVGARRAGLSAALIDPFGVWRERRVDVETVRDVVELAEQILA